MNDKKINEDVLSPEYLFEMGQVFPKAKSGEFSIIIGYSPEKYIGNCYFKVYNSIKYETATKVIRIAFKKPLVITGHVERRGKKEWKIEEFGNDYRKQLINYLNSKSKINPNISVWTELRYEWNMMKNFDIDDIDEYINGISDKKYFNNLDYIPYNIQMPNYYNLQNDKK